MTVDLKSSEILLNISSRNHELPIVAICDIEYEPILISAHDEEGNEIDTSSIEDVDFFDAFHRHLESIKDDQFYVYDETNLN